MRSARKGLAIIGLALIALFMVAACGGSDSKESSSTTTESSGTPEIGVADLTADFSAMAKLKDLASEGEGMIGVLLPDTTTSTRYVQYDAPNLKKAFETAGLSSDQFKIQNAQGSTSTMQQQAEAVITAGASVLLVDPLDPGSGAAIEENAVSKGLKVIDYDRLVTGGPKDRYYVSFNNVEVGELIGQGEVDCIDAWKVSKPNVLVMSGDPTDNNAKLFAQGYNEVLKPHFDDGLVYEGRRAARHVGCADRGHDLRAAVHRAPEHQRGRDAQRQHRERDHLRALEEQDPGEHVPGHRSGRRHGRAAEHPQGLPVRHRLQAVLRRGAGGRGARALPQGRQDAAVHARERHDEGHDAERGHQVRVHEALLGDDENMNDTVVKDGTISASELCAGKVASLCKDAGIQ